MQKQTLPLVFINLDKDSERRTRIEGQLAHLGLPGERLPAVWWKRLPPAEQSLLYSAERNHGQYYQPLVDGEKGCYASHIQAWRQLLASDAPAMVVLEDDVVLEDAFAPPMWLNMAISLPLTVVLCLLMLQPVKGAIVALQWRMRMHGFKNSRKEKTVD